MLDRRNFVGIGVGAAATLIAQGVKADHISLDEYCHIDNPPPPPEPPAPPRETRTEYMFFKNKRNLVIENLDLTGTLSLVNCPGAIIRNVVVHDHVLKSDGSVRWGNITLDNCPGTLVENCQSFNATRGHGLWFANDSNGCHVKNYKSWGCQEDGIQTDDGAFGLITVVEPTIWDNDENAIDMKGGSMRVVGGSLATSNRGSHEPIVLQQNAIAFNAEGVLLIDTPHPDREKALYSASVGNGTFTDCIYQISRDTKWFRIPSNRSPGISFQDLNNFNLVIDGELTVSGGMRV